MEEQGKIRSYSLKFWVYDSFTTWFRILLMTAAYGVLFSFISGEIEIYSIWGYYLAISIMCSQLQSGISTKNLMSKALRFGSTRKEAWVGIQIHGIINCLLQAMICTVAYAVALHKQVPFRALVVFMAGYVSVLAFVRMMSAITLKNEKKWLNGIIYVLEFIVALIAIIGCIVVFLVFEDIPEFRVRVIPCVIIWALAIVLWIVGAVILRRNTKELEVSL